MEGDHGCTVNEDGMLKDAEDIEFTHSRDGSPIDLGSGPSTADVEPATRQPSHGKAVKVKFIGHRSSSFVKWKLRKGTRSTNTQTSLLDFGISMA